MYLVVSGYILALDAASEPTAKRTQPHSRLSMTHNNHVALDWIGLGLAHHVALDWIGLGLAHHVALDWIGLGLARDFIKVVRRGGETNEVVERVHVVFGAWEFCL
jgi:hypothetical protein